ncbi:MAG: TonB family protein, partial [Kiritimatiellia bacterium]
MRWLSILLALSLTATSRAAEPQSPTFIDGPVAVYPAEAQAQRVTATVLLQLDVDESGRVIDAAIVEGAVGGFDEAALKAALEFRFTPALNQEGKPSAARILFRYEFTLERVVDEVLDVPERPSSPPTNRPQQSDNADDVIEVLGRRIEPDVTERVLSTRQIRFLPGTNGDVVRTIQNLPGLARAPLNIGQLLIRGTAPERSRYYLDGGDLPIVFHFGGLSSVINGDSLKEVALLPGSYGVRYGRALGGAVDLRSETELPDKSHGYASVDVFQATLFAEQRIGDRTAVTLSGRRSYIDAVLNPILNKGSATVQAPRYYDLQARVLHKSPSGQTFDATAFLSDDRFKVLGGRDEADSEAVQIRFGAHFQKLRLRLSGTNANGWVRESTLMFGPQSKQFEVAPSGDAYERQTTLTLRHELLKPAYDRLGWRMGVDLLASHERLLYDVPIFGVAEHAEALWVAPAAYIEPTLPLGPVRITAGLRVDPLWMDNGYSTVSVDPRLAVKVDVGPVTELTAATGRFSQPPTLRQVEAEGAAAANISSESSVQTSLGLSHLITPELSVEAVAYYNVLSNLIVGREDRFRFFTGPPPQGPFDLGAYANDGTGRSYGLETQVRYEDQLFLGWVSATFSRSTRTKRPGEESTLFRYDQPVVLTGLGSLQLAKRWRLGGRVRAGSGDAYTPVVNKVHDLDSRTFRPVYGDPDSERLPVFFSLDVRIDKEFVFKNWTLTTYLDLQNATARSNTE